MKIVTSFNEIKSSNLVLVVSGVDDLLTINQFLNENIKYVLEKKFEEWKNFIFDFSLYSENFDKVFIVWYIDTSKEKYAFVADSFRKIPDNFTIITNENSDLKMLLDCSILWKYKFNKYKFDKKEAETFIVSDKVQEINERLSTIKNICLSRDLCNTPTCDKTPDNILEYIEHFWMKNTKIKILDYDDIKEKGLNLLEAVWRASVNKPKLIILERIIDNSLPTYWFVWKGIIFDTGGINIKPTSGLYDMKMDMGWASQVIHTMKELDWKDLNVNIIAAIPLAENSVSSNSYRPSDIITAYNWQTVDIVNTDAEWRLILADAVSYISDNYKLDTVITTATLTWVAMLAMWFNYSAVMWNERGIIDSLLESSKASEEKYSELPFSEYHIEKTKWDISDLKNYTEGIFAGSSMAWAFIYNFLMNNEKFVHLDIAWSSDRKDDYSVFVKWATWVWVDSLSKLFMSL